MQIDTRNQDSLELFLTYLFLFDCSLLILFDAVQYELYSFEIDMLKACPTYDIPRNVTVQIVVLKAVLWCAVLCRTYCIYGLKQRSGHQFIHSGES